MKLSVITDEISRDFITATEVLSELNIKDIELRSFRSGRVPYISEEEEIELRKYIERGNYKVHTISPAVGKLNIETVDLREKTLQHLNDSIAFAKKFDIKNIIIFTFRKKNKKDINEIMPDYGWDIIEEIMEIGVQNQVNILIENHSSCYVSTMETMIDMVNSPRFKNILKLSWDPNNSYQVDKKSYTEGLDTIMSTIRSIHVKDTVYRNNTEEVRLPLGEGMVGWDKIFEDLKRLKYNEMFCVETHYEPFFPNTLKDITNLRNYLKKYFDIVI